MTRVMIFGTFDILHAGHLHLFRTAKNYGDELIVVVARDLNVSKIKGALPLHNERERKAMLTHIDLIDIVTLGDKKNVCTAVHRYKPDIIVLGYDQNHFVEFLKKELKRCAPATKLFRAKPYKPGLHKTHKIKNYLSRVV